MSDSKLLGSLVLFGLFFGLLFALEFVFVTGERLFLLIVFSMVSVFKEIGGILTPIMLLGSYLMAQVPPSGFTPRVNRGYQWQVLTALPLLAFVGTSCLCIIAYMAYEAYVDFFNGKLKPCKDHLKACGVAIVYSYAVVKIVGYIETKTTKARVKHMKEMKIKNAAEVEKKKKHFRAMGAVILDDDDDIGFTNERHEL